MLRDIFDIFPLYPFMACLAAGGTLGILKASWWNAGLQQFARRVGPLGTSWNQLTIMH